MPNLIHFYKARLLTRNSLLGRTALGWNAGASTLTVAIVYANCVHENCSF